MRNRDRFGGREPPGVIVLVVEHGFPIGRDLHREILDRDLVDPRQIFAAHLVGNPVALRDPYVNDSCVEAGLLAQLTRRGLRECLILLDDAGDDVPVIVDGPMKHQVQLAAADDDRRLAGCSQSAATAAWSFAVASTAEVPAGKKIGSPNTTSTSPRHPFERAASHFRSMWS